MKKTALKRKTPLKRSSKPMKRSWINPVSKKRHKELIIYGQLRDEYMMAHPRCERCGAQSQDLHHKAGRGSRLNDVTLFCSLCRPCHDWVHAHANQAREDGWLI